MLARIRVLSRAPINSPVHVAASGIVDAIDGLAEAVTGDRKHVGLTDHAQGNPTS